MEGLVLLTCVRVERRDRLHVWISTAEKLQVGLGKGNTLVTQPMNSKELAHDLVSVASASDVFIVPLSLYHAHVKLDQTLFLKLPHYN